MGKYGHLHVGIITSFILKFVYSRENYYFNDIDHLFKIIRSMCGSIFKFIYQDREHSLFHQLYNT